MGASDLAVLLRDIRACTVCAKALPFPPRPIVQAGIGARIAIIGQAPGRKVQDTGIAWNDDSGNRLRDWLQIDRAAFYDADTIAIVPMGFCYPGKGKSGDLPPRKECAPLWHGRLFAAMPQIRLTLLVGSYAQKAYLPAGLRPSMTQAVRAFGELPDNHVALPHPSWRSAIWMAKNPWFESEILPDLRARVAAALTAGT